MKNPLSIIHLMIQIGIKEGDDNNMYHLFLPTFHYFKYKF